MGRAQLLASSVWAVCMGSLLRTRSSLLLQLWPFRLEELWHHGPRGGVAPLDAKYDCNDIRLWLPAVTGYRSVRHLFDSGCLCSLPGMLHVPCARASRCQEDAHHNVCECQASNCKIGRWIAASNHADMIKG